MIARVLRLAPLLSLFALAACVVDAVPTTPLQGTAPDLVLALPPTGEAGIAELELRTLAIGADRALRERGYRALPADVGRDLARRCAVDAAAPTAESLQRLQREANVDAVLQVNARRWRADGEPFAAAEWNVTWTLRSTHNGAVLWQHDDAGSWHRPSAPPPDVTRAPDAERDVQPFGSARPISFASAGELAQALHRSALARLPRSPR